MPNHSDKKIQYRRFAHRRATLQTVFLVVVLAGLGCNQRQASTSHTTSGSGTVAPVEILSKMREATTLKALPIVAKFTASVESVEVIKQGSASGIPISVEPRWRVGINITTIEQPAVAFATLGHVDVLLHSPSRTFEMLGKDIVGNTFSFTIYGKEEKGTPRYYFAKTTPQQVTNIVPAAERNHDAND